jgi:hypothetical protein
MVHSLTVLSLAMILMMLPVPIATQDAPLVLSSLYVVMGMGVVKSW